MKHQVENQLPAIKLSMQIIIVIFALMLAIGLFPQITQASDKKMEKALQRHLEDSRQIIGKAKEKAQSGIPVMEDISRLKEKASDFRQLYLLLDEQFRMKETPSYKSKYSLCLEMLCTGKILSTCSTRQIITALVSHEREL